MSLSTPAAFLSYATINDRHDQGKITELCQRLSVEVEVHGESFPIFQDRKDIKWGEAWESRLTNSLNEVTFFIPIITPSFFKSDWCRNELEIFLERERSLGRSDLILPIYYIQCPILEDRSSQQQDCLIQVIANRQMTDWRELRFETFSNPIMGKTLAKMATQICDAIERVRAKSNVSISMPTNFKVSSSPQDFNVQETFNNKGNAGDDDGQATFALENRKKKIREENRIAPVDYTRLETLLKEGDLLAADQETSRKLLETAGLRGNSWLTKEELKNLSCVDLKIIDNLWIKYSEGKFGFSVQLDIYLSCGGRLGEKYHEETWNKFCKLVGWPFLLEVPLFYSVDFDFSSPAGHLPIGLGGMTGCAISCWWGNIAGGDIYFDDFFCRVNECRNCNFS